GGAWLRGESKNYGFPAELFVNAGVNYIALDFIAVGSANGDIGVMADQVRRGIAWTYKNAASFEGDANRLYIGGHSSGGNLCGVALVTDWQKDFGIPANAIKGGLCMSGMYDMKPVRLSKRSSYVKFTDVMEHLMSAQRQLDKLQAPIIVTYGTNETPEFQRQNRDFAAAVKAAGKPVELIEAPDYNHFEMCESLGDPYGPNGRAALKLMELAYAPNLARKVTNASWPLLAQRRHRVVHCTCLLLGVKRTWAGAVQMSAFDPKRTSPLPVRRI